jgi:hypothetical protein
MVYTVFYVSAYNGISWRPDVPYRADVKEKRKN